MKALMEFWPILAFLVAQTLAGVAWGARLQERVGHIAKTLEEIKGKTAAKIEGLEERLRELELTVESMKGRSYK